MGTRRPPLPNPGPLPSLTHPTSGITPGRSRTLYPLSLTLTTCVCGSPPFPHVTGEETEAREAPRLAPRHSARAKQSGRSSLDPQDDPSTPPDSAPAVPSASRARRPARASKPTRVPAQPGQSPRRARPLPASCPPPASDSRPQYPRHALRSPPAAGQFTEHTKELTQFKGSKSR